MLDYGTPTQSALRHADLDELAGMSFPAGSMGPKIEACRRFVATTGMPASIGSGGFSSGDTGTQITGPAAPQTDPRRAAGFSSR